MIVLSLCDRTGNMLRPWAEAGFHCIAVDIQHPPGITHRDGIDFVKGLETGVGLPAGRPANISNSGRMTMNALDLVDLDAIRLITGDEKLDYRSTAARRFKEVAADLQVQMGGSITPSEKLLLRNAVALTMKCDQAIAGIIAGDDVDMEDYRRNLQALGNLMIKLGLAKNSRDMRVRDLKNAKDPFAAALLEAGPIEE